VNAPRVLMHPVSRTINLVTNNVNMSLSCKADGRNLKYSWERLQGSLPSNIKGANTPTLYFTFLRPEDAGKYRCKVFNDSGYGYSDYEVLQIHGENYYVHTAVPCTSLYSSVLCGQVCHHEYM